jgi:hypothetical protein
MSVLDLEACGTIVAVTTIDSVYAILLLHIVGKLKVQCWDGCHWHSLCTRWFKYDRDYLFVNKSQFVPVIFEPPCTKYCKNHLV